MAVKIINNYIYKATNKIDGKIYIGKTNNLERRIREHRCHALKDGGSFHEAIRNCGFDNFQFDLLEICSELEASTVERKYIAEYRDKYGIDMIYNYCDGGTGGKTHDVAGSNNPMFGKHLTEEQKSRISKSQKGKPKPASMGSKVSAALIGKKKSKEHVAKRSHPITVINIYTNEITTFPSKAEMQRCLHTNTATIVSGKTTQKGYKLYQ